MVERITVEDTYEMVESGEEVVILDVRRASWDQSEVKIKGALRIHPDQVEDHLDEIPKNKLVVAYCT